MCFWYRQLAQAYGLQASTQLQNYSLSHLEYFCDLITVSDNKQNKTTPQKTNQANQPTKPKFISGATKSL